MRPPGPDTGRSALSDGASQVEPGEPAPVLFDSLGLPDPMLQAVERLGFEHCTQIQGRSLPHILQGKDLLAQAQTGTGKTAAFLLSGMTQMLRKPLDEGGRYAGEPRMLVIGPTRELVMQIASDARGLNHFAGLEVHHCYGGTEVDKDVRELRSRMCDLLVATPGRLLDLQQRGELWFDQLEVLVLDEADRLLDMGFMPDVRKIVQKCPPKESRQTLMFSATLDLPVRRVAGSFMVEPEEVLIDPERPDAETVEQMVYISRSEQAVPFLVGMLRDDLMERVVIFVNTRWKARQTFEQLRDAGIPCGMLSGEMAQPKRTSTLKRFRGGDLLALVATDVAARGLHIEGVSHVVNLDLPEDPEQYVHRIGRTGRAGNKGVAISFATEEQAFDLPQIEKFLGRSLDCRPLPDEPGAV